MKHILKDESSQALPMTSNPPGSVLHGHRDSGALPRSHYSTLKAKVVGEDGRGEEEQRTTSCPYLSAQFRSTQ